MGRTIFLPIDLACVHHFPSSPSKFENECLCFC